MNSNVIAAATGSIAALIATASLVLANDPAVSGYAILTAALMFAWGGKLGLAIADR